MSGGRSRNADERKIGHMSHVPTIIFCSGAIPWKHFQRQKLGSSVAEVVGKLQVKENGPFPAPGL